MKAKKIASFILDVISPFKWMLLTNAIMVSLWAFDLTFRPYLIKLMIDQIPSEIESSPSIDPLIYPAIAYIGMSILITLSYRVYDYFNLKFLPNLRSQLSLKLMNCMMSHSHDFYQNHYAGSLGSNIRDVTEGLPELIRILSEQILSQLLGLIASIITLGFVKLEFSLALIIWASIFLLLSYRQATKARLLGDYAAEVRSNVVGKMIDTIGNMMSVRLFTGQQAEIKKLRRELSYQVQAEQNRDWSLMRLYAIQGILFIFYQSFCMITLLIGYKKGQMSGGDFALVLSINLAVIDCLTVISRNTGSLTELSGNITQGLRVILSPSKIIDKPSASYLIVSKGEIVFDQVRFNYLNSPALFEDKSVFIPSGQKIGLVGYSGSGKSTFVNLILRLFDISSGKILIDNQDISEITQESLRKNIGMIPQEPSLFQGTLIDNIRYGRLNATDEEVIRAAQKAHAHDFIIALPQGYQTQVGERAIRLSAGQRQRIAIARAILKNAPILILDEATCQLDVIVEQDIRAVLLEVMKNKTTIVIAHRLSTLIQMDRILLFENGRIIEDGTHRELSSRSQIYRTFCNSQTDGLLPQIQIKNLEEMII